MEAFLLSIDLKEITLACQDWGGLIGLRLVAAHPEHFDRIVAANTFLPTGDNPAGEAFLRWQQFAQTVPDFPVGRIVNGGCVSDLTPEVIAAHDAPFQDNSYKEGARQFPLLVPASPDDPAAAANRKAREVLQRWDRPFLMAFSDSDPITRGGDRAFQSLIPGTRGRPHTTIEGAGHFLQEDKGEQVAQVVIDFIARTPRA